MIHQNTLIIFVTATPLLPFGINAEYQYSSLHWYQPRDCLLSRLFMRRSQKTGEFPAQRASNAENVSIWWRHHAPQGNFKCAVMWWLINRRLHGWTVSEYFVVSNISRHQLFPSSSDILQIYENLIKVTDSSVLCVTFIQHIAYSHITCPLQCTSMISNVLFSKRFRFMPAGFRTRCSHGNWTDLGTDEADNHFKGSLFP